MLTVTCNDFLNRRKTRDHWIRNTSLSFGEGWGEVSYGIIGGGQTNYIAPGTNHSSIFSGHSNKVSGSCSSILRGSGNNDNGFTYVGIYGQNVNGVMNNAFHVEELVLQNIPVDTTATGTGPYFTLPFGALYTTAPLGSGFKASQIYIK